MPARKTVEAGAANNRKLSRMGLPACLLRSLLVLFILICLPAQAGGQRPSLALFNLRPVNFEAMTFSGEILFTLVSSLELEKNIELMPRREMEDVLYREGLVQNDDPEQVAKAAKVLAVNYILFGSVEKTGGGIRTDLKLMDVSRKKVVESWRLLMDNSDAIGKRVPVFAGELASCLHKKPASPPAPSRKAGTGSSKLRIDTLTAQSKGNEVVLSWHFDPDQSVSGFNIYRSCQADGPYQYIGQSQTTTYRDKTIKKGFSYYYHLGILDSSGEEEQSERTAFIEKAGEMMPFPPLIMGGEGHVRRAVISFVPSLQNEQEGFDINSYKVYRKAEGQVDFTYLSSLERQRSSFSVKLTYEDTKDLEDGQTYTYVLKSVDRKKRESIFSDPVSITLIDKPQLCLAKDLLLREVRLRWEKMENIQGYYLYRRPAGGQWQKIKTLYSAGQTNHTDTSSLEDGRQYEYYLSAYDDKRESSASNTVVAATKDRPPHPRELQASSGLVKSVRLTWEMVDDPDIGGYSIYRGLRQDELEQIARVGGYKTISYLDKGSAFTPLADGVTYYYGICSYNLFDAEGEMLSPPVRATTKPRPVQVRELQVTPDTNAIVLEWRENPEKDVKLYEVKRRRDQGWWSFLNTVPAGGNTYRDADLKPDTRFQYQVIAVDEDELKSDPAVSESVMSPLVRPEK